MPNNNTYPNCLVINNKSLKRNISKWSLINSFRDLLIK